MKLLKERIVPVISVLSAVIICLTFLPLNYTAGAADISELADAAAVIIYQNEGSYTSVNPNDYGAVSIGKVQWHASRALSLLKTIVASNEKQARSILGDKLTNEIKNAKDSGWSSRTFSSEEAAAVSKLLGTPEGRVAQDDLAAKDIQSYISHGMRLGITDEKALVYFADIENQAGYSGAERIASSAKELASGYDMINLDILHKAAMASYLGKYTARRTESYNYCAALIFGSGKTDIIGSVKLSDITEKSCRISFTLSSDKVKSVIVYVRDTADDTTKMYTADIKNLSGSVTVNASDFKSGKKKFAAKIMAFTDINKEPADIYENISIELKQTTEPAPEKRPLGDINGDMKVTASDARLLLRYTARLERLDDEALKYSDVTKDGKITASDARLILRASAGLSVIS